MKHEELIGQKIAGFKFSDNSRVGYTSNMDKYIGKLGRITSYDNNPRDRAYNVRFSDNSYWYPADEVEQRLEKLSIKEEPELTLDEIFERIKNLKL